LAALLASVSFSLGMQPPLGPHYSYLAAILSEIDAVFFQISFFQRPAQSTGQFRTFAAVI